MAATSADEVQRSLWTARKKRLANVQQQINNLQVQFEKVSEQIVRDEACLVAMDSGADYDPDHDLETDAGTLANETEAFGVVADLFQNAIGPISDPVRVARILERSCAWAPFAGFHPTRVILRHEVGCHHALQ